MKRSLLLLLVIGIGSGSARAVLVSDFTGVENITCQATAPAPPVGTSQGAFETNLAGHPHAYCMGVWAPVDNTTGRRSWTTWTLDQPYDFWHGGTNLQASFDMLSNQATSWATIKLYDGATLLAQKDCTPGASNVGVWVTYNFADILTSQCTHVTKIVWSSGYAANFYQHLDNFNANAVALGAPASLAGTIVPVGYRGDLGILGVGVELRQNGALVKTVKTALSDNGSFLITGIDSGVYDVAVKSANYLRAVIPNVTIDANPTTLDPVTLLGGDGNGDNTVTFEDFSILQNNYGHTGTGAAAAAAETAACGPLGLGFLALSVSALLGLGLRRES